MNTLQGSIENVTLTPTQARKHFRYPFVGKGTPEQDQIAIQLVYRYHKARSTPISSSNRTLSASTLMVSWAITDPGSTTLIGDLLDCQGRLNRMTDINDLKPAETYILGHCSEDGSVFDHPRLTVPLGAM